LATFDRDTMSRRSTLKLGRSAWDRCMHWAQRCTVTAFPTCLLQRLSQFDVSSIGQEMTNPV